MSTNSQDQEIDLRQIGNGIKNFFKGIVNNIFDLIFFVKKKIIIIGILFVIGVALAYMVDSKTYNHEISVIPNFGSNEYLYKKIEQIDTKLREEDDSFFKELGIKNPKDVVGIEIEGTRRERPREGRKRYSVSFPSSPGWRRHCPSAAGESHYPLQKEQAVTRWLILFAGPFAPSPRPLPMI